MFTQVILSAVHGELAGQRFVLEGDRQWLLGRAPTCALRLPGDATVSRQHCVVEVCDSGPSVCDLGSLNGTFLNDQNIGRYRTDPSNETMRLPTPRLLGDGDELRVGHHVFRVRVVDQERGGRPEEMAAPASQAWAYTVCC
jgi:pSer/pThr/pTyr-binding forkhead associated (FHA) protein